LSYSNQLQHAVIDRRRVKDYLLLLAHGKTAQKSRGRSRDEQYSWLLERIDQNSTLEREFLRALYETRRRLPDRAQFRPASDIYAEADFYYERDGIPGACIFCDGPDHDLPQRRATDEVERGKLSDRGFRVLVIRYDRSLEEQLSTLVDVFGNGAPA